MTHDSETPEDNEINILSQDHPHANYVILENDTQHELKIPSGFKTGVKIVKGFTINENGTTEIILDFDAMSSVVEAGNSGKWLLKPTINVGELDDYAIINGRVTNDSDQGLEGVYVSAQIFDGDAQDDKDKVFIQAGTLTDDEGYYSIFVMPGTYNLVAYIDDKEFEFVKVETEAGEVLEDTLITYFQLSDATAVGTVEGEVLINGADDNEHYATISYRQDADCLECVANEKVELKSLNVLNGAEYETQLPTGSYSRVASTYDYTTQTFVFSVIEGTNNLDFHDIQF
jgi:hypothetical protein